MWCTCLLMELCFTCVPVKQLPSTAYHHPLSPNWLYSLSYWCPSTTIITNNQSRQDASSSSSSSSKNEFPGIPKVQINKYTGRPFSQRFCQILEKWKTLPVWEYYTKFMELLQKHKCVVLVGETGSGKTTQVEMLASRLCIPLLHLHSCCVCNTLPYSGLLLQEKTCMNFVFYLIRKKFAHWITLKH